jgi:hypothetical protein
MRKLENTFQIKKDDIMKSIIAICLMLLVMAGCSDNKSVTPDVKTYNLSGHVVNQTGGAALDLSVVVSGQHNYSASTTTDSVGAYTVAVPEGASTVTFSSTETIIFSLPRYISRDTAITTISDTTLNIDVREFITIFHDAATLPSAWNMYGGVSYDSTKYIFQDDPLAIDHMMQIHAYSIPDSFQHVGFILYGQAAPSNTSAIIVNAWINGHLYNAHWTATFSTTSSYYHGGMDTLPGLSGGGVQLDLIFNEIDAAYVYLSDIWIYCY